MRWSQESKRVQKIHFVVSVWNVCEAAECNLNRAAFIDLGFSSLEWRCVCEKRWRSIYWQRKVWFVMKSIRRNGRKEKGERGFMDVVKKDMKLVGVRRGCRAEGLMKAGDSLWSPQKGTAHRRNFRKNLRCWFWKIAKNKQLGTLFFYKHPVLFPGGSRRLGSSDGGGCGVQTGPTAGLPDIHGSAELREGH